MVLSSLSVVVSSLALNAYRRPALHRIGSSSLHAHMSRFRTSSEARRRVSQLRPFLHHRTSSASASNGNNSGNEGDVELGAVTIAQGRRNQHQRQHEQQHRRSRSQPHAAAAAGASAATPRRASLGSVDSLGSLASSLGSAASDDVAAAGGGLGALGVLSALDLDMDLDASSGLSRLWQRWRGYRNLPPEQQQHPSSGRGPVATMDVRGGEGGWPGQGRVSSHRETV